MSGTQNWLGQGSRPRKPDAATPITVNFVRLSEMVLPRMLGSAANWSAPEFVAHYGDRVGAGGAAIGFEKWTTEDWVLLQDVEEVA